MLSKSVILEVNKICKDFLWSINDSGRRMALVSWQDVCRNKCDGGLNILNPLQWNEAYLEKQVWELATMKENLWVKWIKRDDIWNVKVPKNSGWNWK